MSIGGLIIYSPIALEKTDYYNKKIIWESNP